MHTVIHITISKQFVNSYFSLILPSGTLELKFAKLQGFRFYTRLSESYYSSSKLRL